MLSLVWNGPCSPLAKQWVPTEMRGTCLFALDLRDTHHPVTGSHTATELQTADKFHLKRGDNAKSSWGSAEVTQVVLVLEREGCPKTASH